MLTRPTEYNRCPSSKRSMTFNRFDYLEIGQQPDPDESAGADGERRAATDAGSFGPPGESVPGEQPDRGPRAGRRNRKSYEPQIASDSQYGDAPGPSLVTYHPSSHQQLGPDGIEIRAVEVFGSRGAGIGEFNFPAGLAVDSDGILFVADVYNHRVQRITPDGGVGIVGTRGSGKTQFLAPSGVAVDANRAFYIVELGNHRVQKFSCDGLLDFVIGKQGGGAGEFRSPAAICISPTTHEILVADTGNGRVQRFAPSGKYIGSLGAAGSIQPALVNPQAVTCDQLGNIYVADTLSNRIARYDPLGRFTGHFGGVLTQRMTTLAPNVRFSEPHALACNQRGDIFIADGNNGPGRVVVLTSDTGTVRATVDEPGRGLGKLSRPGGIAIGPRVRADYPDGVPRADLYLSDTMNHRIIRFTCT
jgi:tripartite motif-containing protein 71